jgi:hypothetical protein
MLEDETPSPARILEEILETRKCNLSGAILLFHLQILSPTETGDAISTPMARPSCVRL